MSTTDDKHELAVGHAENMSQIEADTKGLVMDSDAAAYIDPTLVISEEENTRLRKMIHYRLLPVMCLCYITQSLDKGTLGSASIMGWLTDVNAKGQDYALTGTILWSGIVIGEPLANQLVRRLPVAKLLGVCMIIWSAIVMRLAFSLSMPPVFALRFFLGFFESVFGPSLLTITVQWYRKSEQPFVEAIWQSMLGVAGMISSLLAFGFYHLKNKHAGLVSWQWLTVMISIFSFCMSVVVLIWLPDSPARARWASEEDKVKLIERVRVNDQGIKQKKWKSDQAWEAFKDPVTYLLFLIPLFSTAVVGGIGTFNSLLINKAFGFSVADSQLLSIPLNAVSVLFYFLMGFLIKRTGQTLYCIIGFTLINVIGTIVLITVAPGTSTRGGLIVAFYLMQAEGACNPAYFLMLSRNSAGQTKKSITYALTYIGWAGGNAAAPQIFRAKWAPRYLNSLYIHLGLYACLIAVCLIMRTILVARNKRKIAAQTDENGVIVNNNLHAFEDLTDMQNPDFRYSL